MSALTAAVSLSSDVDTSNFKDLGGIIEVLDAPPNNHIMKSLLGQKKYGDALIKDVKSAKSTYEFRSTSLWVQLA